MTDYIQELQVKPPQAKRPFAHVAVGALKVDTCGLQVQRDVPTPTALIGDKWEIICCGYAGNEGAVVGDGIEAVGD